jgi:hypothetical protein
MLILAEHDTPEYSVSDDHNNPSPYRSTRSRARTPEYLWWPEFDAPTGDSDPNQDEAWTAQEMITAFGLHFQISENGDNDEASQAEQAIADEERNSEDEMEYRTSYTQKAGQCGQVVVADGVPEARVGNSHGDDEVLFVAFWALLVMTICYLQASKNADEATKNANEANWSTNGDVELKSGVAEGMGAE